MGIVPPRHLLVLTYWRFDDALIQTYTLPYVRLLHAALPPGSTIRMVTLEAAGEPGGTREIAPGLFHIRLHHRRFGARAMGEMGLNLLGLAATVRRHRIDGIHAWCTTAGSIGYMLSRLTGVPLVIDSYEPHAEAMVENGSWQRDGVAFRLLFALERAMSHHARALIAAAPGMRAYAEEKYGLRRGELPVKPACVDLERFSPARRGNVRLQRELGLEDKVTCVYAGKFGGIYLDREVFDLFAASHARWGERFRALVLTSHRPEDVFEWARQAGVPEECLVVRFVPHAEVPDYMGLGDFALTPVRPVPSKIACTPIKDGEYWALGLPVVITAGISEDSEIIASSGAGVVWTDLSLAGATRAIAEVARLLDGDRAELTSKNRQLAERHRSYSIAERVYANLYA